MPILLQPQSTFLTVNGLRWHYLDWCDPSASLPDVGGLRYGERCSSEA